jgi:hypothetical protein
MFYQATKTAKAAVIGTIIPWSGSLSTIPDGWIICDGSSYPAKDYPLLVQAIGDTYNAGTSNLGGSFPNYSGNFILPSLNNKILMDIEEQYFGSLASGGTGKSIDTDTDARSIVSPFIGDNTDNGVPVVFTNVYTDVVFTLNDRTGYAGKISGNVIVAGEGSKTMYVGGRKLGTSHIRSHSHSGSYETLANGDQFKPGKGVIPWGNVRTTWTARGRDAVLQLLPGPDFGAQYRFTYSLREADWSNIENRSGFGTGSAGRTLARVVSENPPVNLFPRLVMRTPIKPSLMDPKLDSGDIIPYGLGGANLQIPTGYRNHYPETPALGNFGTLVSNTASDWLGNDFIAHNHDSFEVVYDQNSLKPQSSITATVNIPSTTVLDNATNIAALQIDMNTSQPAVTCIYIIRAY